MIDEGTKDRMEKYFQQQFSLHSLVENDGKLEIVDFKITDDR